jgi:hypothetical protein
MTIDRRVETWTKMVTHTLTGFVVLGCLSCGAEVQTDGLLDGEFINVFSGQSCRPDPLTFNSALHDGSNGNTSPTGIPGDNMDDLRSGKVDCLGDGNSGQGDDAKHSFCGDPPPGCDDGGCCEEGCGEEPAEDPVVDDPPEEPVVDDPPAEDPPQEQPPEEPPAEEASV